MQIVGKVLAGKVSVIDIDGNSHTLRPGQNIFMGDTIRTLSPEALIQFDVAPDPVTIEPGDVLEIDRDYIAWLKSQAAKEDNASDQPIESDDAGQADAAL